MNNCCPACGVRFEREAGYFAGAMYICYGLTVLALAALMFVASQLTPDLRFAWLLVVALAVLLPFLPAILRLSRVLWMNIDHSIDPGSWSLRESSTGPRRRPKQDV